MHIVRQSLCWVQQRLSRKSKQLTLLLIDAVLPPVVLVGAVGVAYGGIWPFSAHPRLWYVVLALLLLGGGVSAWLGLHRVQLKSYETTAVMRTAVYAALTTAAAAVLMQFVLPNFSVAGLVLYGLMLFFISAGLRMGMLHVLLWVLRQGRPHHRVLIYGAGTTGVQLVAALRQHERIVPVAFIDDNAALQSSTISGLKVLPPSKVKSLASQYDIDRIILAMPSVSAPKLARLTRKLRGMGLTVQSLPSFAQLVGEEELIDSLSPVAPGQFLGRDQLSEALPHAESAYSGKSILVSGAGGSVGSELCRQLIDCHPRKIVLYEVSEVALYLIDRDLREASEEAGVELVPVLGSVTDSRLTRMVMADHAVEVVFHAAAYKHVPLMEVGNAWQAVLNNVLGTYTVAQVAIRQQVEKFVLISTDKAVNPTNVMGASKRLAEMVCQGLQAGTSETRFVMVRFGNVLGSAGSVIPKFQEQIRRGGPVTVTHPEITRYFMSIPEASQLVLQAGLMGQGGEIFVMDMGDPVKIIDLARDMIRLSGFSEAEIGIVFTGLRPGEKLYEELLANDEHTLETPHPKLRIARARSMSPIWVDQLLTWLMQSRELEDEAVRAGLKTWLESYSEAEAGVPTPTQNLLADQLEP